MFRLAALLVIVISSFIVARPQAPAEAGSPKILLEANYIGVGMVHPLGSYLVPRITSDGRVQFDDEIVNKNGVLERYIVGGQLRAGVPKRLTELLASESVALIPVEYQAFFSTIDHTQDLILKIMVNGTLKEIRINNFKPNAVKAREVYPDELIELACIAQDARINASLSNFFSKLPCILK